MPLVYFLFAISILALLIATIVDLRKREVPNWLSFAFIAIALIARLIFSLLEGDFSYLTYGVVYTATFVALAYILYYVRIFAGGDAKLLMGLGAALAPPPNFSEFLQVFDIAYIIHLSSTLSLPLVFLVNLFFVGSAYGLLISSFLIIRHKENFFREFNIKKGSVNVSPYALLAVLLVVFSFLVENYIFVGAAILTLILPYAYLASKIIEEIGLTREISAMQLQEGDWIVREVRVGKKVIRPSWEGLGMREIKLLQKSKKKVLVKSGIPFVPALFIALIVTFLFGNLFKLITLFF